MTRSPSNAVRRITSMTSSSRLAANDDAFGRATWAFECVDHRVADPEGHHRLPSRLRNHCRDLVGEVGTKACRLLALGPLDHLVQGLHGKTLARGPQVHALPDATGLDPLRIVAGLVDDQRAEGRRCWQLTIAGRAQPALV